MKSLAPLAIAFFLYVAPSTPAQNPLLPKQELLEKETFWDNKVIPLRPDDVMC